eukprot:2229503-Rhodomonas_salina.1
MSVEKIADAREGARRERAEGQAGKKRSSLRGRKDDCEEKSQVRWVGKLEETKCVLTLSTYWVLGIWTSLSTCTGTSRYCTRS